MKKASVLVWLPLAFIVGGLVGAYGPTEELRTREERADAEKAKTKARQKASGAFGSFAQIVNIPDEAKRPRRPRSQPDVNEATNAEESASGATDADASRHATRFVRIAVSRDPCEAAGVALEDFLAR